MKISRESIQDSEIANEFHSLTGFNFLKDRITSKSDIPELEPIVTIGDANFAIKGDISFISGLPKSGKSTVCGTILATALMEKIPLELDTLKIRTKYCEGNEVIYIDTEQPKIYTLKTLNTIKQILNVQEEPEHFHLYNLRNYNKDQKLNYVESLFEKYPKTHLWVIDGIADLIHDNNDGREAEKVINSFMAKASIQNTTIILILHENATGGKMRGHTGSEAERKCGGSIAIRKDRKKGIHWIESKMIRGSKDFESIYFEYDEKLRRMVTLDEKRSKEIEEDRKPENVKMNKYNALCVNLFVDGVEHITSAELVNRIELHGHIGRTSAFKYKRDMIQMGIILEDEERKYYWNKVESEKAN